MIEKLERKTVYSGVNQDVYEYSDEKMFDKINEIIEFLNKSEQHE